jgi:molecular chaperone GrpE
VQKREQSGRSRREHPEAAQETIERSDEVAASAAPQGDGVPDEASVTAPDDPGAGTADTAASGSASGEAQRLLDEQRDKYLRLAAEFDNYRKRTTRERMEAGARGQGELVRQLLDALDDLARFAHVDPATTDAATVVQGVELVERKMHKALGAAGLEVVNPVDQQFNPQLHEAVATERAASPEDDQMVSRVFQHGYLFGGQLLRPARVVVKVWNG